MLRNSYRSAAGSLELGELEPYHNEAFGYTLFEEVFDPKNPEGPRAIAMHVPANSMSKAWLLIEPDYKETVELLEGSGSLVLQRADTGDWTTMPLTSENPTADDVEISCGDVFCVVTEESEIVLLSRPSKPFEIEFEAGVTSNPKDPLSRFIISHVASIE